MNLMNVSSLCKRVAAIIDQQEPGMITWHMAIYNLINDLIDEINHWIKAEEIKSPGVYVSYNKANKGLYLYDVVPVPGGLDIEQAQDQRPTFWSFEELDHCLFMKIEKPKE